MFRGISSQLMLFLPLTMVARFDLLIDQFFVAKISPEHLTAFSWLILAALGIKIAGLVIARGAYLIFAKPNLFKFRADYAVVAVILSFVLSAAAGIPILAFSETLTHWAGIQEIAGIDGAIKLVLLAALLANTNMVLRFYLMSVGKVRQALKWDLNVLALGTGAKLLVLNFAVISSGTAFTDLLLCGIAAQVILFGVMWRESGLKLNALLRTHRIYEFLRAAKPNLIGEFGAAALASFEPLLFVMGLKILNHPEAIGPYSVGHNLYGFLFAPLTAITLAGIPLLARSEDEDNAEQMTSHLTSILRSSWIFSGIPSALAAVTTPLWFPMIFGVDTPEYFLIAAAFAFAVVPMAAATPAWCQARLSEKTPAIAGMTFACFYLAGLPLGLYSVAIGNFWLLAIVGIFLPRLLREVGIILICKGQKSSHTTGLDVHEGITVALRLSAGGNDLQCHLLQIDDDRCRLVAFGKLPSVLGRDANARIWQGQWDRGTIKGKIVKVESNRIWNFSHASVFEFEIAWRDESVDLFLAEKKMTSTLSGARNAS